LKEDLLMIRSNGSASLVGRTAVVEDCVSGYAYAGYLVRLRIFPQYSYSRYLNLALNTFFVRQQIEVPIRTTSGVKNINSTEIANILLPLPPFAEQKRIVAKVDELMKLCDQLEASLHQSQQRAQNLAASAISHLII
jgi:type I restriction enzyme S subunit